MWAGATLSQQESLKAEGRQRGPHGLLGWVLQLSLFTVLDSNSYFLELKKNFYDLLGQGAARNIM